MKKTKRQTAPATGWRDFEEARTFARSLGFKAEQDWIDYCLGQKPELEELPADIPRKPHQIYSDCGWCGYRDWLSDIQTGRWRRFRSARRFARALGLTNEDEWRRYVRGGYPNLPPLLKDIPPDPAVVYNDHWQGMEDWLQTGNFLPFEEARDFVRSLGLKTTNEWHIYLQGGYPDLPPKPANIPSTPYQCYAKRGWVGITDWLGTAPAAEILESCRDTNRPRLWRTRNRDPRNFAQIKRGAKCAKREI